jgi:hypothetical protein
MQSFRLPQVDLNQLILGAQVLEADSYGAKVYLLDDGNILKLFRRKRLISSALLRPYSQRFIDNAIQLEKKGIPTLKVLKYYKLDEPLVNCPANQVSAGRNAFRSLSRWCVSCTNRESTFAHCTWATSS